MQGLIHIFSVVLLNSIHDYFPPSGVFVGKF